MRTLKAAVDASMMSHPKDRGIAPEKAAMLVFWIRFVLCP
jgi:hypothetical protein